MLWNATAIDGYAIAATDGRLGTVSDFLFDDSDWLIRWLVVDTGHWLSGRKVLLPPSSLGPLDPKERTIAVRLTMRQVENSPDINTDLPVSRQMETNIFDYYGWSPYWESAFPMGENGILAGAAAIPPLADLRLPTDPAQKAGDPHLFSVEAITGYHIHATDGEIGHVEDFLVAETNWSLRYLVIDTKNWWPGEKVLISPRSVEKIDWIDELVHLTVRRQKVKDSPAYDAAKTVDQAYEKSFHDYYDDIWPGTDA